MTEYRLMAPMIITPSLTPGAVVPAVDGEADTVLSVEAYQINDGRVAWKHTICRLGSEPMYGPSGGLHTGPQYGADGEGAAEAVAALCSFLAAEAERYQSWMHGRAFADGDGWMFNERTAEWAYVHADEIAMLGERLHHG